MDDIGKSGVKTSEFWLTFIANVVGSIVAILAARGLLTQEEGDLWMALIQSIAVGVIPLALAYVNGQYIQSRRDIKTSAYEVNIGQVRGDIGGIGDDEEL
jgi:hypothetical protein